MTDPLVTATLARIAEITPLTPMARMELDALLTALVDEARAAEASWARRVALLRAVAEEAQEYARQWPIGTSDEPQEQRGGARDTLLANLHAALDETQSWW